MLELEHLLKLIKYTFLKKNLIKNFVKITHNKNIKINKNLKKYSNTSIFM